jgi:hypothetical protein
LIGVKKISADQNNHDNQRSIRYWQNLKSVFLPHHLVAGKKKCPRLRFATERVQGPVKVDIKFLIGFFVFFYQEENGKGK